MPSKPVLSEADKKAIRKKREELCEECWIAQGYKKTSIKNLCDKAVISIGTFYTLYQTKEDLFLQTMTDIQKRLTEKIIDRNRNSRTKEGFAQSMKSLFREYDSKPFLYNVNTPDFQSFVKSSSTVTNQTIQKFDFCPDGALEYGNNSRSKGRGAGFGVPLPSPPPHIQANNLINPHNTIFFILFHSHSQRFIGCCHTLFYKHFRPAFIQPDIHIAYAFHAF